MNWGKIRDLLLLVMDAGESLDSIQQVSLHSGEGQSLIQELIAKAAARNKLQKPFDMCNCT